MNVRCGRGPLALGALLLWSCSGGSAAGGDEPVDAGSEVDAQDARDAGAEDVDVGDATGDGAADGSGDATTGDATPDAPDPLLAWRDEDSDAVPDRFDNCVQTANPEQADADADGVGNACDVCVRAFDPGQLDTDADGVGDACELETCQTGVFCGTGIDEQCCGVGEECIGSSCVAACAFGVRCAGLCCDDGELCLDGVCSAPGAPCTADGECPFDAFCDVNVGRCLPIDNADLECRIAPDFDVFAPTELWHWQGVDVGGTRYANVMATPAVADLDGDGVPEVVFPAYADALSNAVLVVVGGATGDTLRVDSGRSWRGGAHAAVGDIDGDGFPEVVAVALDAVVALDDLSTCGADAATCVLWSTPFAGLVSNNAQASVALHDLDADGVVEVVVGATVFDGPSGALLAQTDVSTGLGLFGSQLSAVADVVDPPGSARPDGQQELLTGDCAWRLDRAAGALVELWCNDTFDNGFAAVADLVGDGRPEVVTVHAGDVTVLDGQTGLTLHTIALPGDGHGGSPNIADFDGDGQAEIGVANSQCYSVVDVACFGDPATDGPGCARPEFAACTPGVDCSIAAPCPALEGGTGDGILWSVATQDLSSSMTGSSVFDFQGDGRAEVIYNDECRFLALDGQTGTPYLARYNTSRTGSEYPVVVDVDGDNRSDIVLVANNDQFDRDCAATIAARPDLFADCAGPEASRPAFCSEGTAGVRAWRDPGDAWVRTRAVWNQHAYSVTNVNDDGTIPARPSPSWSTFNTYRANRQGAVPQNAADLVIGHVSIDNAECPFAQRFVVSLTNRGELTAAPGVPIALYTEEGALEVVGSTRTYLSPGASEVVVLERPGPMVPAGAFAVVLNDTGVDGLGPLVECDAENNTFAVTAGCLCQSEACDGIDNDCNDVIDEAGCLECGLWGDPCAVAGDCCALECVGGVCGVPCRPTGATCIADGQCCEGRCSGTASTPGFCVGL